MKFHLSPRLDNHDEYDILRIDYSDKTTEDTMQHEHGGSFTTIEHLYFVMKIKLKFQFLNFLGSFLGSSFFRGRKDEAESNGNSKLSEP